MLPFDLLYPILEAETRHMRSSEQRKYAMGLCSLNRQFLQVGRKLLYTFVRIRTALTLYFLARTIKTSPWFSDFCTELCYRPSSTEQSIKLTTTKRLALTAPIRMLAHFHSLSHLEWTGDAFEDILSILLQTPAQSTLKQLKLFKVQLSANSQPLSALLGPTGFANLDLLMLHSYNTFRPDVDGDGQKQGSVMFSGQKEGLKLKHSVQQVSLSWSSGNLRLSRQQLALLPETLPDFRLSVPMSSVERSLHCLGRTSANLTCLHLHVLYSQTSHSQEIAYALSRILPYMSSLKELSVKCVSIFSTILYYLPESLESLKFEDVIHSPDHISPDNINAISLGEHLLILPRHLPKLANLHMMIETKALSDKLEPFLKGKGETEAHEYSLQSLAQYAAPLRSLHNICAAREICFTSPAMAIYSNLHTALHLEHLRRKVVKAEEAKEVNVDKKAKRASV